MYMYNMYDEAHAIQKERRMKSQEALKKAKNDEHAKRMSSIRASAAAAAAAAEAASTVAASAAEYWKKEEAAAAAAEYWNDQEGDQAAMPCAETNGVDQRSPEVVTKFCGGNDTENSFRRCREDMEKNGELGNARKPGDNRPNRTSIDYNKDEIALRLALAESAKEALQIDLKGENAGKIIAYRSSAAAPVSSAAAPAGSSSYHQIGQESLKEVSQHTSRSWLDMAFDKNVLDIDVFDDMPFMVSGASSMKRTDPVQCLTWLMFGYVRETNDYEGLTQSFRGYKHENNVDISHAGKLLPALKKLVRLVEAGDKPENVYAARAIEKVVVILAGGTVPPSLHASHAYMRGIPLELQQIYWATPVYETTSQYQQVGKDILASVCGLLAAHNLIAKERPAVPVNQALYMWRNLELPMKERNWRMILHDPACRSAFYDVTGQTVPNSIEDMPTMMAPRYDFFSFFWSIDAFMSRGPFEWRDAVDVYMMPMDVVNPRGST